MSQQEATLLEQSKEEQLPWQFHSKLGDEYSGQNKIVSVPLLGSCNLINNTIEGSYTISGLNSTSKISLHPDVTLSRKRARNSKKVEEGEFESNIQRRIIKPVSGKRQVFTFSSFGLVEISTSSVPSFAYKPPVDSGAERSTSQLNDGIHTTPRPTESSLESSQDTVTSSFNNAQSSSSQTLVAKQEITSFNNAQSSSSQTLIAEQEITSFNNAQSSSSQTLVAKQEIIPMIYANMLKAKDHYYAQGQEILNKRLDSAGKPVQGPPSSFYTLPQNHTYSSTSPLLPVSLPQDFKGPMMRPATLYVQLSRKSSIKGSPKRLSPERVSVTPELTCVMPNNQNAALKDLPVMDPVMCLKDDLKVCNSNPENYECKVKNSQLLTKNDYIEFSSSSRWGLSYTQPLSRSLISDTPFNMSENVVKKQQMVTRTKGDKKHSACAQNAPATPTTPQRIFSQFQGDSGPCTPEPSAALSAQMIKTPLPCETPRKMLSQEAFLTPTIFSTSGAETKSELMTPPLKVGRKSECCASLSPQRGINTPMMMFSQFQNETHSVKSPGLLSLAEAAMLAMASPRGGSTISMDQKIANPMSLSLLAPMHENTSNQQDPLHSFKKKIPSFSSSVLHSPASCATPSQFLKSVTPVLTPSTVSSHPNMSKPKKSVSNIKSEPLSFLRLS